MDEIVIECNYEPTHQHCYPSDWEFGGASCSDPRADIRWRPTVYEYFDAHLHVIHTTSAPICDDQAIDEFTKVSQFGAGFNPVFLSARRSLMGKPEMLPWRYDKETDEVIPLAR